MCGWGLSWTLAVTVAGAMCRRAIAWSVLVRPGRGDELVGLTCTAASHAAPSNGSATDRLVRATQPPSVARLTRGVPWLCVSSLARGLPFRGAGDFPQDGERAPCAALVLGRAQPEGPALTWVVYFTLLRLGSPADSGSPVALRSPLARGLPFRFETVGTSQQYARTCELSPRINTIDPRFFRRRCGRLLTTATIANDREYPRRVAAGRHESVYAGERACVPRCSSSPADAARRGPCAREHHRGEPAAPPRVRRRGLEADVAEGVAARAQVRTSG